MKILHRLLLLLAVTPALALAQSPAPSASPKRMASFRPPKGWTQTGQLEWTNTSNGLQTLRIAKSEKPAALDAADPLPGVKQAFSGTAGSNPDVEATTVCDGTEKAYRVTANMSGGSSGADVEETLVIGTSTVGLVTYMRTAGKPADPVAVAAIDSLCWP